MRLASIVGAPTNCKACAGQRSSTPATHSKGYRKRHFSWPYPLIRLCDENEWPETVAVGWNLLAGNHWGAIIEAIDLPRGNTPHYKQFGESDATLRIAQSLTYLNEC